MTPANRRSPDIVIILLENDQLVFENALSRISNHFETTYADTAAEAKRLIREQLPYALIGAGSNPVITKLFRDIRGAKRGRDLTPPLIQIVPTGQSTPEAQLADMVVACEQIDPFLLPYLEQCRENASLREALSRVQKSSDSINFLKNSIVGNVAHELRTPLLQVKSAVALLAEDAVNNPTLVELAMRATTRLEGGVKNITLLNELINESLDTQSFEPVLLSEVFDSAIRNLRRSWEHKDQIDRIQATIPENLPPTLGDKQRLAVALQLLTDNALKFSKKDVYIKLKLTGKKIRVSVQDFGIGIPKEQLDIIFDTFYQVDNSTTKRYGGMGIGLAIVRFILERHNTQIHVESVVGKGSTFWFELPVIDIPSS